MMYFFEVTQLPPGSQVSVLSQAGGVDWSEDKQGLHVMVSRTHSVQLIKAPAALVKASDGKSPSMTWSPDWPIVVKITNATVGITPAKKPAAKPAPKKK